MNGLYEIAEKTVVLFSFELILVLMVFGVAYMIKDAIQYIRKHYSKGKEENN